MIKSQKQQKAADKVVGKAVQLIRMVSNTAAAGNASPERVELCQEGIALLQSWLGVPLGIHVTGGCSRTGKSLLNNRLLLQHTHGGGPFVVGETVNACTMGLWVATQTIASAGGDYQIMVVDMEGLSALRASEQHDLYLLAIGLLMASCFTMNIKNAISESTLVEMAKVVEVAKCVRTTASTAAADAADGDQQQQHQHNVSLADFMPNLMFLVRDFGLDLLDSAGQPMSPDDYLEQALQHDSESTDASRNEMRRMLRELFPRRRCCTLQHPGVEKNMVQQLNSIDNRQLPASFVQDMQKVRTALIKHTPLKRNATGQPITGPMLVPFLQSLVDAFNGNAAPVIENAWAMASRIQLQQSHDIAIVEWMTFANQQQQQQQQRPLDLEAGDRAVAACLAHFDANTAQSSDTALRLEFRQRLVDGFRVELDKWNRQQLLQLRTAIQDALAAQPDLLPPMTTTKKKQQKAGDLPPMRSAADIAASVQNLVHDVMRRVGVSGGGSGGVENHLVQSLLLQHLLLQQPSPWLLNWMSHALRREGDADDDALAAASAEHVEQQRQRADDAERKLMALASSTSQRIADVEKQKAETELELERARDARAEQDVTVQCMREEQQLLAAKNQTLREEAQRVYDLQQQLDEAQQELDQARQQLQTGTLTAERRIDEIEKVSAAVSRRADDAQRQLQDTQQQLAEQQRQQQKQQLEQQRQQKQQLEQQQAEQQRQQKQQEQQLRHCEQQHEQLQQQLQREQEALRYAKQQLQDERQRRLADTEEQRQALKLSEAARIEALQQRMSDRIELVREHETLKSQLQAHQAQLADRKRQREQEMSPDEMEKRKRMRLDLEMRTDQVGTLQAQLDAKNKAMERQSAELARLRAEMLDMQTRHSDERHRWRVDDMVQKTTAVAGGGGSNNNNGAAVKKP